MFSYNKGLEQQSIQKQNNNDPATIIIPMRIENGVEGTK